MLSLKRLLEIPILQKKKSPYFSLIIFMYNITQYE